MSEAPKPWGVTEPRKPWHLPKQRNRFGFHDRVAFTPVRNFFLRCPACGMLMTPDFALETRCPNCKKHFTKAQWADMSVEAMQVEAIFGQWTPEALEYLNRLRTHGKDGASGYISPKLDVREMSEVARNVAAHNLALREKGLREERARRMLPSALRNLSPVSRALRKGGSP